MKKEKILEFQIEELIEINKLILTTLQTILKVSAIQVGNGQSTTERARSLKMTGLDNQTIGDLLNTSRDVISVLTTNLRGSKNKKIKLRIINKQKKGEN